MAIYKVPQDVEAEDKLVGPLSFRQFVYLIIAFVAATLAFFMFQVFPLLAVIPLPVALIFGILALPLRKDQPMETYVLALLRFYLKPKQRLWNPDGTISYVEITAPKVVERHLAKDFGAETASERLDYLARVIDSRGWALKGVTQGTSSITAEVAAEVQSAPDVLDESAAISQSFKDLIAKNDQQRRQAAVSQMQNAAQRGQAPVAAASPPDDNTPAPHYSPYPSSMHQKVVRPISDEPAAAPAQKTTTPVAKKPAPAPVTPAVSPDIIRLANNDDLSITALAHEAHRLQDKEEVVINLH